MRIFDQYFRPFQSRVDTHFLNGICWNLPAFPWKSHALSSKSSAFLEMTHLFKNCCLFREGLLFRNGSHSEIFTGILCVGLFTYCYYCLFQTWKGSIEIRIKNVVDFDFRRWVGKMEFLVNFVHFIYEDCSFLHQIICQSACCICQFAPKMFGWC